MSSCPEAFCLSWKLSSVGGPQGKSPLPARTSFFSCGISRLKKRKRKLVSIASNFWCLLVFDQNLRSTGEFFGSASTAKPLGENMVQILNSGFGVLQNWNYFLVSFLLNEVLHLSGRTLEGGSKKWNFFLSRFVEQIFALEWPKPRGILQKNLERFPF